jgi:hypothetical protein
MYIETTKTLRLTHEEFDALDKARNIMYYIWLNCNDVDGIGDFENYNFKEIWDFLDKFMDLGSEYDDEDTVTFVMH